MVKKLQAKMREPVEHKFNLVRVIKAHMLPITNVAFNKMSTMFCTGSYDRTCKVFETNTGRELYSLEGKLKRTLKFKKISSRKLWFEKIRNLKTKKLKLFK